TIAVVWWLLAAATSAEYFAYVDGILTSWLGTLVMLGSAWALCYHLANGIRHLVWDMGLGFELDMVTKTGFAVLGASGLLTLLILITA
ncbi:MAG: succinate dehydrogenase, cytochrome b556 subunit, partial [Pseudomonadota bacterium]